MKKDIKTFVPAAGLATRLGGIPKFLLPVSDRQTLIGFHIDNLKKIKNNEISIGTNKKFYKTLQDIYEEITIKKINSSSMVQTVTKLNLENKKLSLVIMPDTYFENYKIIEYMREKIISSNLDVVLGIWKIKQSQIGKLGQCMLDGDSVKKIIDKDVNCKEEYFWGLIMWQPSFNNLISDKDLHFGISLNRAIENKLKIGYVKAQDEYFDCGTFDEYQNLLKNINS